MSFEWKIAQGDANDIIGTLLKNRGIEPKDAEVFLNPDWDRDTHDPFSFTNMRTAVARVFKAFEKGEKIKIHGDYDADGISGSTLLYGALNEIVSSLPAPLHPPIAGGRPRLGGDAELREVALSLRKEPTPAEGLLWELLRKKQIAGFKFRRQHGIGPFVADFYCDAARLVIEIDGDIHLTPEVQEHDRMREEYLTDLGYEILRLKNEDVMADPDAALKQIVARLPSSYGGAGGGGLRSDISVFLPDRERDGYGVAVHNIEAFAKEGIKLLVTVDCGISNIESLNRAHELGIDVIICDHHQLAPTLPEYAIVIHPLAPGEMYPNKSLCGTGVAFKLASALFREAQNRGASFPTGHEKWYLDLVAIATVTDVMPLIGENRVLEKYGLVVLNKTRREGIRKIIDYSRTELGKIDTEAIGFQIGPRINAAGRISTPEAAFRTLASRDAKEAQDLAAELERLNRERQRISDLVFQQAKELAKTKKNAFVNVIWQDEWRHGVVGLVAGKLVQEFGVPAFVFTKVGNHYVGSGRSVGGMHLVEAMRSCGDIFIKAGGHPQACGLTISDLSNLELFEERVTDFAKVFFAGQTLGKRIDIDAEILLSDVTWDLLGQLEKFEPFGEGNRKPKFLSRNLQVVAAESIGSDGKHLRLTINDETAGMMKLIGFGFGKWSHELHLGDLIDVVYEIGVNEWNGRRELQLKIEDLRRSDDTMSTL